MALGSGLATRVHVPTMTIAHSISAQVTRLGSRSEVLKRVSRLSRARISVVDQAAATNGKQLLVSRTNTVAGLLALLTALLSRIGESGLVFALA